MTDVLGRLTNAVADRYRIERELGQGGMATVYLAHDVRHDRKVALKVLRPELSAILGGQRFLAEIKTTANLQHPHILSLFDSGEAGGLVYYVMPFVDGESLRDRLTREKQLPVDDAVRIAGEVADALQYAHSRSVVHRDIKPENILLHGGHALVADFGIALAASRSDGGTRMTETGMSLGTPHYMAPEQAMGEREITPKADIYALGCVLYEMLTGEPPFTGPTAQAVIARVMTEEPRSLTLQRKTVPPPVEAAVQTALAKLPADRFTTALEFAEALKGRGPTVLLTRGAPAVAPVRADRWRRAFAVSAAVAVAALALAGWGWARARRAALRPVAQHYISFGDSATLATAAPSLALSPDGALLVFHDGRPNGRLWLQRRDELDPTPIPGTERATSPVFSPDGRWIAYVADGRLFKVRPDGGPVVTVADTAATGTGFGGAAWLDDGTLVFTPPSLQELRRVSAEGGPVSTVLRDSTLRGGGIAFPVALPHSRGVLYQVCSSSCITMSVHVLDLRTGKAKLLVDGAAQAWCLPDGRLLYVRRDGVVLIAPFDLGRLEVTGVAVPVLQGVLVGAGFAHLAWSPSGTLVYLHGAGTSTEATIARVGRDGVAVTPDSSWHGIFQSPTLSPDGRQVAVGTGASSGSLNIWVKQLPRGPFTRLTFGGSDRRPAWSPDGRTIAFIRDTLNTGIVVSRPADGSGQDRRLVQLDRRIQEVSWSPDGRWLLVRTDNGEAGAGDILAVRTSGDTTPVPVLASRFTELSPAVSPDGRWIAYTSDESGTSEVYVRPFPATGGGRWQVSNGGGSSPRWSPAGRELFYIEAASRLVAAEVRTAPTFAVTRLHVLFSAATYADDPYHASFDVARDGRSFVFVSPLLNAGARAPQVVWVDGWLGEVQGRAAP
jgi:serine/threonine-protein kinase